MQERIGEKEMQRALGLGESLGEEERSALVGVYALDAVFPFLVGSPWGIGEDILEAYVRFPAAPLGIGQEIVTVDVGDKPSVGIFTQQVGGGQHHGHWVGIYAVEERRVGTFCLHQEGSAATARIQ